MKHKENAGKHQTGKAGTSRRRHLPRLSAISSLALTALLLSAGISEQARALTFTFEYTYTITANTCNLSAQGTRQDGQISGSAANLYVDWGTVTKDQLTDKDKASKKTFGLVMDCDGDIWQPKLTVTSVNGNTSSGQESLFVTDSLGSVAGFAVRVADGNEATEKEKIQNALTGQGEQALSETVHSKKMLLTAWPTIMPDKKSDDLKSGTDIKGTVTIKVVYN
ncbi:fimbrial protein [Salmonella enterica subsp. enterica serovar Stanley]|nr:fimbrial protein [Salmonella enterica subsp. enterica serovar Stanley]